MSKLLKESAGPLLLQLRGPVQQVWRLFERPRPAASLLSASKIRAHFLEAFTVPSLLSFQSFINTSSRSHQSHRISSSNYQNMSSTQVSTGLGFRTIAGGIEASQGDFSTIPIINLQESEEKIVESVSIRSHYMPSS